MQGADGDLELVAGLEDEGDAERTDREADEIEKSESETEHSEEEEKEVMPSCT